MHTYYVGVGGVSVLVHNAERIPPFVTEMLRRIKDGSLGPRLKADGSSDIYKYREPNRRTGLGGDPRRNKWWDGAEIYGVEGNNSYIILEKDGKYMWIQTTTLKTLDRSATSLHCE
ncbi:hypothetical protein AB0K12_42370 [Nonomuraea sp. NPDC049419]|uniref:hypothetical protein n=1 Tax=Nonomuraea sp. NPDC049419 TaxID=3155772 RepID=UPI00343A2C87